MSYKLKAIAIMQPTFLPWLSYFAMLKCVDEFVFLDTVQFDTRSWLQRNRICHNEELFDANCPCEKMVGANQFMKLESVKNGKK